MKKVKSWIIGIMFATVLIGNAQTVVPSAFNYQGVLRAGDGTAIGVGNQQVEFKLYNEATGGSAQWGRMYTVVLDANGLFNVELEDDSGSKLSDVSVSNPTLCDGSLLSVVSTAEGQLFIGITVVGDDEIAPRQQLLSVPYAFMAGDVHEARTKFDVHGPLSVDDGAKVAGTMQANSMIITTNGWQTTLGVNNSGNLTTEAGLLVNGNAAITGNDLYLNNVTIAADGALDLVHVYGTLKTEGLIAEGTTEMLSQDAPATTGGATIGGDGSWEGVANDSWTSIIEAQETDGMVVIELEFQSNNGKSGEAHLTLTQNGVETTFNINVYAPDKIQHLETLPLPKGAYITAKNMDPHNTGVRFRARFFPFGL
ncbi:hypothetical protein [Pontiella sulfatireligans]|uniref:Uncharacterized protein n=1 Tax=Pontiella sulfatireligans TaxID=2750658 RepID=A0A6C2UKP9_9BACT|nr:hypothetical protein [Pontiella sulfatireligans]VGO20812.1 hypothetical protein SCARR_02879 [Pontiella sulfatireligans]